MQCFNELIKDNNPAESRTPGGGGRKQSLDFELTTKLSPLTKVRKTSDDDSASPTKKGTSGDEEKKSDS